MNSKRFFVVMFLAMLIASAVLPAAYAGNQEKLSSSEMVILRPHETGPTDTLVYMKDESDSQINGILRTSPEFVQQVRLYQAMQRTNFENSIRSKFPMLSAADQNKIIAGFKPDPVYVVVNEGMTKKVSFATSKPFGILTAGADGKTSLSIASAPIVTLAADTVNELKTGDRWGFETVCHEVGHVIMYPTHGYIRYPQGISENIVEALKKEGHWKSKVTTPEFALLEGWAEFNGAFFTSQNIGDYSKIDGRQRTYDEMIRTEGLAARVLMDVCTDPKINPDKNAGYQKIIATMKKHKPQTLNSFLVNYVKDYPAEKEAVENIVKADTNGVVKINYDYKISDWFKDKVTAVKNVISTFKDWLGKKFAKKDGETATAASAPARIFDEQLPATDKEAILTEAAKSQSGSSINEESLKLYEQKKALFEKYKQALTDDDKPEIEKLSSEIKALDEKIAGSQKKE